MDAALFVPAGDGRWLPTELSMGPWSDDALHGGPVAALLARAAEQASADHAATAGQAGLQPTRITVELLRPVPLAPLTATADVTRPGRKVQLVEASLRTDRHEVARATVLSIRTAPVEVPSGTSDDAPMPPGPEHGRPLGMEGRPVAFHIDGVDHRFVTGHFAQLGPAVDWIRLAHPVVPGEDPSPLQRVAAAGDFGNGISALARLDALLFINPDLTIHLHRLPVGEWVCLDAVSHLEGNGVGLAQSVLYDEQGPIGRALQSLLIEGR